MSVKPISVPVQLPNPALPSANWADCYQLTIAAPGLTAIGAARLVVGHFPLWVRMLMTLRNRIVSPFGIKSSEVHSPREMEMVGIFPVVSKSRDRLVLGFDDRHLDFRLVITVEPVAGGGQRVSATSLVYRKILLGKIYIAIVAPFHRLIVARMLARLGRRDLAIS